MVTEHNKSDFLLRRFSFDDKIFDCSVDNETSETSFRAWKFCSIQNNRTRSTLHNSTFFFFFFVNNETGHDKKNFSILWVTPNNSKLLSKSPSQNLFLIGKKVFLAFSEILIWKQRCEKRRKLCYADFRYNIGSGGIWREERLFRYHPLFAMTSSWFTNNPHPNFINEILRLDCLDVWFSFIHGGNEPAYIPWEGSLWILNAVVFKFFSPIFLVFRHLTYAFVRLKSF